MRMIMIIIMIQKILPTILYNSNRYSPRRHGQNIIKPITFHILIVVKGT